MGAGWTAALRGRLRERALFEQMLDRVRGGEGAVLVVRGEAGIGKTALLNHCAHEAASGCLVRRIAGVESEMKVPLAAVHQLCQPMLGHLKDVPAPQAQAMRVAFGIEDGRTPDRFLLSLAVLSLMAEASTDRPLVCLVDDAQWLDEASAQVLTFVGRRLLAESVLLVLAVRELGQRLFPELPEMIVEGLGVDDARALLTAVVAGPLHEHVRDRIVAETGGNPLALLELPRGMSEAELAGGFAMPSSSGVATRLQDHYLLRLRALPEPTQQLMLLAAAEPTGDARLLWRAARARGLSRHAAEPAAADGLLRVGSGVWFRHPLVRSVVYAAASGEARRAAHLTLADAMRGATDPERRVWHLAAAASAPDEDIADQLERTASRVQARAGLAAAAAFLQRSAELTAEPGRRAGRALSAAQAHVQAGAFDVALQLLAEAEADAADDLQRALVEQLRGRVDQASVAGRHAPVRLRQAAARLEPLDVRLARETYLEAWGAALIAGHLVGPGGEMREISEAALALSRPDGSARVCDLLLDALATMTIVGRVAAEPALRRAVDAFAEDISHEDLLQWGIRGSMAAHAMWDFDAWSALGRRLVEVNRASGAVASLSVALNTLAVQTLLCGDFDEARALVAEEDALKEVAGIRMISHGALLLAAYRGRQQEAAPLLSATAQSSVARGEGLGSQVAHWATSVLCNGLGDHAQALLAARQAVEEVHGPIITAYAFVELVEAAVRAGENGEAADAVRRLAATVIRSSDWGMGLLARTQALVSEDHEAEQCYEEAIERLRRTQLRLELARARLLYGEWLRRADARSQLRSAYELFADMGAQGFAERAQRELVALGERILPPQDATRARLTPQEEHIAILARDGRTNTEIGSELFISARTVEWHLRKVFAKLNISSRKELRAALASNARGRPPEPAPHHV
jgi:DNA-binding CsgD family transcriptional regulator